MTTQDLIDLLQTMPPAWRVMMASPLRLEDAPVIGAALNWVREEIVITGDDGIYEHQQALWYPVEDSAY